MTKQAIDIAAPPAPGRPQDLVTAALSHPLSTAGWPAPRWALLLQQARAAGLLARLADRAAQAFAPAPPAWPAGLQGHVEAAQRLCRAQQEEVRREVHFIARALAHIGAPVVLLKGAAYVMAGLPAAEGRIFSDVDILVPKAALGRAESALTMHGWMSTHHSAYDQRYYREWMHELPPMQHVHRGTTIDVHHTLLPETARLRPHAARLFERAVALPGHPGLHVLGPADMVLHSMTHLFMNEEMSHALRDLTDIDLLLRHFGRDASFWPDLVRRGAEQDLARPLFYGLRYAARQLGTPVPSSALDATAAHGPGPLLRPVMDAIWLRALRPPHRSAALPGTAAALFALYLRGHWLRMPPLMLVRHLAIKALRLHEDKPSSVPNPTP